MTSAYFTNLKPCITTPIEAFSLGLAIEDYVAVPANLNTCGKHIRLHYITVHSRGTSIVYALYQAYISNIGVAPRGYVMVCSVFRSTCSFGVFIRLISSTHSQLTR